MPPAAKTRTGSLLVIATSIVVVSGVLGSSFLYIQMKEYLQDSIQRRTHSIATLIYPLELMTLSGTEADTTDPSYQVLKSQLMTLRERNEDVRFIYLMGMRGEEVYFVVDSEHPDSEDYSPPGQTYEEATPEIRAALTEGKSGLEFSTDRWGSWISGFAPIWNTDRTHVIAIAGIDVDAHEYWRTLIAFTALPLLGALFLATLLLSALSVSIREARLTRLKTELLSIAAHDIRNPLIGIKWTTSQILGAPMLDPVIKKSLRRVGAACDALLVSVENILAAVSSSVREQTLGKSDISIDHILQDTVQALFLSAEERNIHIAFAPSGERIRTQGNPDVVRRIAMNVLSNAIKYSHKGSAVSMRASGEASSVVITVKDAGIGIPEEDVQKVTSGFYRSANARSHATTGTGLGLYYCKRTVEEMGGSMSIQSKLNEGTTIIIRLPVVKF